MLTSRATTTLIATAIVLLLCGTAEAFNKVKVRVPVNSSSTFGACWDPICDKPDQFVAFYGENDGRTVPRCPSSSVINTVFVGPPAPNDWSCTLFASRPGSLFIALYDGDGPNGDNTAGQQIDIAPGTALSAMVDVEALARSSPNVPTPFTSAGSDGTINFTVTAIIEPGKLDYLYADRGDGEIDRAVAARARERGRHVR